jgi:hypothetical protein
MDKEFKQLHKATVMKRAIQGAAIGMILIIIFIFNGGDPNPGTWSRLWFLRPLIFVMLAGAGGGVFYFLMDHYRQYGGWKKGFVNFLSLIVFLFALWIGTVLGLAGTLWH